MKSRILHSALVTIGLFLFCAKVFAQTAGTFEITTASTHPVTVSENQPFKLVFSGYNLDAGAPDDGVTSSEIITVEVEGDMISVTSPTIFNCFATPPAPPPNVAPTTISAEIPGISAGNYTISASIGSFCYGEAVFTGEITIFPNNEVPLVYHESPRSGQVVSGVGVIRGWACYPKKKGEIGSVTYSFDNDPTHYRLPYGSLRTDTAEVCDYQERDLLSTGYGGVYYWGHLTEGPHIMKVYVDGEEIDSVDIVVATPPATDVPEDNGFRKGAEGEYIVESFLGTQETVTIRWSEADQNFIIVDFE